MFRSLMYRVGVVAMSLMCIVTLAPPAASADVVTNGGSRISWYVTCNAYTKQLAATTAVTAESWASIQRVKIVQEVYSYNARAWMAPRTSIVEASWAIYLASTSWPVNLISVPRGRYFFRAALWYERNGVWVGPYWDTPAQYIQTERGYAPFYSGSCYV